MPILPDFDGLTDFLHSKSSEMDVILPTSHLD